MAFTTRSRILLFLVVLLVLFVFGCVSAPPPPRLPGGVPARVVCALTTRSHIKDLPALRLVLDAYTVQFDAVYLGRPSIDRHGVSYEPFEHPGVQVVHLSTDYGPICKIITALEAEADDSDTLVVIVDDDHIPSPNLRESMIRAYRPGAVVTASGAIFKYGHRVAPSQFLLTMTGRRPNYGYTSLNMYDHRLHTVAGYAAYGFARTLIPKADFMAFVLPKLTIPHLLINDDILISAYFAKHDIPRIYDSYNLNQTMLQNIRLSEALSRDTTHIGVTQLHAFQLLYDECFVRDGFRYDTICLLDLVVISGVGGLLIAWSRK